jgi:hypothetical protein
MSGVDSEDDRCCNWDTIEEGEGECVTDDMVEPAAGQRMTSR